MPDHTLSLTSPETSRAAYAPPVNGCEREQRRCPFSNAKATFEDECNRCRLAFGWDDEPCCRQSLCERGAL